MVKRQSRGSRSRKPKRNYTIVGAVKLRSYGTPTTSYDTSLLWSSSRHIDSDILDAVEFCLYEWASWARQNPNYLGFPKASVESQIGLGRRDKKSGVKPEDEVTLAAAVEAAVVDLPDLLRAVALKEYLDGRGFKRQRARDLGMGETRYSQLIHSLQYAVHAASKHSEAWQVVINRRDMSRGNNE